MLWKTIELNFLKGSYRWELCSLFLAKNQSSIKNSYKYSNIWYIIDTKIRIWN